MIQLSKRLQAVADLGKFGDTMADIGTDHGYIPIYLIQSKRISHAVAMDIGKGPLLRAQEHIAKYQLGAYIETRLSDGAKELCCGEVSSVVIAGMGGVLMQKILRDSEEVFRGVKEIILQPQSEIEQTRRFLLNNGYEILAEDMVLEDGKYYPMMRVSCVESIEENPYAEAKDIDFVYGAYLLKERHPVLRSYLYREIGIYRELEQKLKDLPANEELEKRRREVGRQLALAEEALIKVGETDEMQ